MIKRVNNREHMIPLWKEAFGDTAEDIVFFLDFANNYKCVGYYEKEALASMLFLLDCGIDGKRYHYIYAACTSSEFTGNGYMTKLLQFCKENYRPLCLIPASDGLEIYYKNRGFDKSAGIETLEFNQIDEIKEYLFEGYELTEPKALIYEGV